MTEGGRRAVDRRVLLVAFHFPPVHGSSGVQRTLRFAQHLPKYGWEPIVLTIVPRAYEATRESAGNEVPASLEVHRAHGFDTRRQLSLFGRYPRALALPDRWATWRYFAVRKALAIVRGRKVNAVWSTFPIATAHQVGLGIARRTGLPWVAEFRDPMWQGAYPPDPRVNSLWKQIEVDVFTAASRVVVTTPGAVDEYAARFPEFARNRLRLIQNGYDEETFRRAEDSLPGGRDAAGLSRPRRPITLLHSGVVYRSERDPSHLFAAIASLKRGGRLDAARFQLLLRASGDDRGYRRDVNRLGIDDIVRLEPAIGYLEALQEMMSVDGLLLLQSAGCNAQVPAKLYEYLRAGRPIIALTDPVGDTARTLASAGAGIVAHLDSQQDIETALLRFIDELATDSWRRPPPDIVAGFSRRSQTGELARLLDEVVGDR